MGADISIEEANGSPEYVVASESQTDWKVAGPVLEQENLAQPCATKANLSHQTTMKKKPLSESSRRPLLDTNRNGQGTALPARQKVRSRKISVETDGHRGPRVITVGSRIATDAHLKSWLRCKRDPYEDRCPGVHYASHARVDIQRPRYGGSSEGNRFIFNEQL